MIKMFRKYEIFISKLSFLVILIISYLCGKCEFVYYLFVIDSILVIFVVIVIKYVYVIYDKGK